ncbi:MAG: YidC/Oxa1 family membrane protein insertase [Candidatus Pacebacteria bacterium]|nr:YidC/Oxa1 family membrane protein insertase [Candidatus Paceibacterota bacterium]
MIEIIKIAFESFFYKPLFNGLIFIYYYIPGGDLGITIILFTLIIKTILYPLGAKAIKSQKSLNKLSPKIKEIQEKYKNDKEKQTKEIMEFYKKEKINPFSGCLPLLIQLPILLALFKIFKDGFGMEQMNLLYTITPHPEEIFTVFLKLVDLADPNLFFAILAGVSLFFQMKISIPKIKNKNKGDLKSDIQVVMQKQMQYFLPFFIVIILLQLPSALGLYWIVSTLFAIGQHYIINKNDVLSSLERQN